MLAQILAVSIFVVMFVLIIFEIFERHYITLVCGALTLLLVFGLGMKSMTAVIDTINFKSIFTLSFWYAAGHAEESSSGINWATIRHGTRRLFQMALYASCKSCKISDSADFCYVHDYVRRARNVHRFNYGYSVSCSRYC